MNNDHKALSLTIQSHRGPYQVHFGPLFFGLENGLGPQEHLIIDTRVAKLYPEALRAALQNHSVLQIEATEKNKCLEKIPGYVTHLLEHHIKRNHRLIVVGGGILQDIGAFIATILFRGISWSFYPTTLLAQADSCIGSKSSINIGNYKNQLGTYTPPEKIFISQAVLKTLDDKDFCSGFGEIIKVHLLSGWEDFRTISKNYSRLRKERDLLIATIHRSLEIKKKYIEKDEFDHSDRLMLNYGHSFGHAIESATHFVVPHGIAVTLGMDMANFISYKFGFLEKAIMEEMQEILKMNAGEWHKTNISLDQLLQNLSKDKKNTSSDVTLILNRGPGQFFKHSVPLDEKLSSFCEAFFRI